MGLGDSDCPHCVSVVEDSLHVLRDCPLAVSVWNVLVNATARGRFFFDDLQGWIDFNMSGCLGWDQNSDWSVIWARHVICCGVGGIRKGMRPILLGHSFLIELCCNMWIPINRLVRGELSMMEGFINGLK